jgi:hypothetical protein
MMERVWGEGAIDEGRERKGMEAASQGALVGAWFRPDACGSDGGRRDEPAEWWSSPLLIRRERQMYRLSGVIIGGTLDNHILERRGLASRQYRGAIVHREISAIPIS